MKKVCGLLLLLACAAVFAAGQGTGPAGRQPGPAELEVRRLEREWLDAYEKFDAAAMDRIVADDFTITFPDGRVQTKSQIMGGLKRPRPEGTPAFKFHTEGVESRAYGDTVILTGRVVTESRQGEKTSREEQRYTDTYVRLRGRWRVVASHLSNVPPPRQ
jgi:ketosteroid isomerase-like protein